MKIYYLHLKNIDFTPNGSSWVSGVIDLYDNTSIASMATPSYVNYSTTKSAYGTNLIGDNTWTGFDILNNSASPTAITDSGYMKNGGFVDTTGKIDITTWEISINNFSKENVTPYITVYNNDNKDLNFPDEWYGISRVAENKGISIPDAPRYAKFVLDFDTNLNVSNIEFDLYVRVRIGRPVMSPLYSRTQSALRKFPEWMELRRDSELPATPSLATPTTIAGSFVNAVAGEWLDALSSDMNYVHLQRFVESADVGQIAWAYVVTGIPNIIVKVFGDSIELKRAYDVLEFTESYPEEDIFYWDEFDNTIYTRKFYENFVIDDMPYTLVLNHVWNWFDEHGLAVDLERIVGESNDSFRKRIIDVYKNKPGVGVEAFKLALRRELNLWSYWGATPDSDYVGATPEVLEMRDIFVDSNYVGADGVATDKLSNLVELLSEKYPTTWGYFKWGNAYWDIDGNSSENNILIANRFDAEVLPDANIQSGVGDDLDLYVYSPNTKFDTRNFNLYATARGFVAETGIQEYAPVKLDVEVYGRANQDIYDNPEVSVWLSLHLTMEDGKQYRANYEAINKSGIDYGFATPNTASFTEIPLIEEDKMNSRINWFDMSLQQYIVDRVRSEFTKDIDITGRKIFAFPRGSIVDSNSSYFSVGKTLTLSNGTSSISGNIDQITQSYSLDGEDQGFYDFVILSSIETNGDITGDNWSAQNYIDVFYADGATPSFAPSSLTVEYGKYDFTPANIITSSTSYLEVDSTDPDNPIYYRYFAFPEGTVSSSTPYLVPLQKIVLHRESSLITGTVIEFSGSYLGNSAVDALKVRIDSISGEPMDTANVGNWSIYSPTMKGIVDFPTSNVGIYLSDNVKFGAESTELRVNSATPSSSKLTTNLTNYPSIKMLSYQTNVIANTKWESDHILYNVTVNSSDVISTQGNWSADVSEIKWHSNLSATPNKEILVEILTSENGDFCGISESSSGEIVYIPKENIYVNGVNSWTEKNTYDATPTRSYVISLPSTTQGISVSINTTGLTDYPFVRVPYSSFEESIIVASDCTVDENGPWVDGVKPTPGSDNYDFITLSLDRDDFSIDNTQDFIVTWIGVTTDDNRVISWMDQNSVKTAISGWVDNSENLTGRIEEHLGLDSKYYFDPFVVKVRLKPDVNPEWNPSIHSGWFYDKNDEYYLYSNPSKEVVATPLTGATYNHFYAQNVVRQGAPVIVNALVGTPATPKQLRQVSFFDEDINLTLKNKQRMYGNSTNNMYLAYPDIYDATVSDITSGNVINTGISSHNNVLSTTETLLPDHLYEVSYRVRNSFYVDNDYIDNQGNNRSRFVFDSTPSSATPYSIVYESSKFEEATPLDLPLNPFYTVIDEGFIYLSHNEYDLDKPIIRINPGKIIADGKDYVMVTIYSIDINGNSKPNQTFSVSTDFGTFDDGILSTKSVTTDSDGFAVLSLKSAVGSVTEIGTITVVGETSSTQQFDIDVRPPAGRSLYAIVSPDAIPADGISATSVTGRVVSASGNPVPYAYVSYRRGRSMYDVFTDKSATPNVGPNATPASTPYWPDRGRVLADSSGVFSIGPFTAATPDHSGYWFLIAESFESQTEQYPIIGDAVYWQEYPPRSSEIHESNLSVRTPINQSREDIVWQDSLGNVRIDPAVPYPATINAYPVTYDEATPTAGATPVTINWSPPKWYGVRSYDQYQRGLIGNDFYDFDISRLSGLHPDYRDI